MKSPNKQASDGAKSNVSGLAPVACAGRLSGAPRSAVLTPQPVRGRLPLCTQWGKASVVELTRLSKLSLGRSMTLPLIFHQPKQITQPFLTSREWGCAHRRTKNIWQIALRIAVPKDTNCI